MIQKLRRLLRIESYEEALRNFALVVEQNELLKAEIDMMAREYLSSSKELSRWLSEEKETEVQDLIKSQQSGLTSRYLSFLTDKSKEYNKLEDSKSSFIKKYPDFEKALTDLKKNDFLEHTLGSYRGGQLTLVECDTIIKAVTKKKVLYSDNIVFNQKGEILITQRGPLDTKGANLWVLPGGHVDMGEEHEAAAKRELLEETGYTCEDCYQVGEFDDGKVHIEYFVTMVDTNEQEPIVDAEESRATQFIPVKDLYKYPTMFTSMWDNVYQILGIKEHIVKIKKAVAGGLVKSEKAEKAVDEEINELVKGCGGGGEKEKFHKVMKKWKSGTLKSGESDEKVIDQKQAIAIAMSVTRQSKEQKEKAIKDTLAGGKADNKTLEAIAKKHKVDLSEIEKEYKKGLKVESEHTDDEEKAGEIVRDHLTEMADYYSKLAKMESKKGISKAIEETDFTDKQKTKIEKFISSYKGDFKDEDVHNFAEGLQLDIHEVEEYIYSIARKDLKTIKKSEFTRTKWGGEELTEFEKAKQLGHLVPKKVQIKGKDGKIHLAIRWVNPQTGEPEKYAAGLKEGKKIEGENFEDVVAKVVASDLPRSDKVRNLVDLGVYDLKLLTFLTGETYPQGVLKQSDIDLKELPDNSQTILTAVRKEQADNDTPDEREENSLLFRKPEDVEELWVNYRRNMTRVIAKRHKFAIVYGTGGVGKTYEFEELAKKSELREYNEEVQPSKDQYDYALIAGGRITPTQVYAEFYRHRDKLIVFDDCDNVLSTDEVQGFLKGGLDTGERTQISNKSSKKIYNIEGDPESGAIPNTFSFKGRVIAITNLTSKQIPQAIKSRGLSSNLTMTIDETILKLANIKDRIVLWNSDKTEKLEVTQEARDYAFEILKENKDKLGGDVNTRTYSNAVLIADEGMKEDLPKDRIKREIVGYFDSVAGNFDEMIRQIKGKK